MSKHLKHNKHFVVFAEMNFLLFVWREDLVVRINYFFRKIHILRIIRVIKGLLRIDDRKIMDWSYKIDDSHR